jgi:acylphosphatase
VDGDAHAVEAIIRWARRGPPAAVVSNVIIEDAEPPPGPAFHIAPTH